MKLTLPINQINSFQGKIEKKYLFFEEKKILFVSEELLRHDGQTRCTWGIQLSERFFYISNWSTSSSSTTKSKWKTSKITSFTEIFGFKGTACTIEWLLVQKSFIWCWNSCCLCIEGIKYLLTSYFVIYRKTKE